MSTTEQDLGSSNGGKSPVLFGFTVGDEVKITGQPYIGIKAKVVSLHPGGHVPVIQIFVCEGKDKGKVLTVSPNNIEFVAHGEPVPPEDLPKPNTCMIL